MCEREESILAKLVILTASWGIVVGYWASAWFPVLDVTALLFGEIHDGGNACM